MTTTDPTPLRRNPRPADALARLETWLARQEQAGASHVPIVEVRRRAGLRTLPVRVAS
jgi:hypothetical protein